MKINLQQIKEQLKSIYDTAIENEGYIVAKGLKEELDILDTCDDFEIDTEVFTLMILEESSEDRIDMWIKFDKEFNNGGYTVLDQIVEDLNFQSIEQLQFDVFGNVNIAEPIKQHPLANWKNLKLAKKHQDIDGVDESYYGVSEEEIFESKKECMEMALTFKFAYGNIMEKYNKAIEKFRVKWEKIDRETKKENGIITSHKDIDDDTNEYYGIDENEILEIKKEMMSKAILSDKKEDSKEIYNQLIKDYKNEWLRQTVINKRNEGLL